MIRATSIESLMRRSAGLSLALLAVLAPGCVIRQAVQPQLISDVDELMDDLDLLPAFQEPVPASGSLWTDAGPGAALARDPRAFRTNDLVTIQLDERALGTHSSDTDLNRSSEADVGAGVALGYEDPTPSTGGFNLNQVLSSSFETGFSGDGTTTRSSALTATITARVMRVLPNSDLIIGGQKTVMINRERQILTLVGSIRAVDVGPSNRVSSSRIGDLTVRLWGRGEIDDTIRQGWFMRILNRVWPF